MATKFNKGSLRFHLLIILGICIVLYIMFFTSLSWLTHHGDETKIPDVTGKDLKTALSVLKTHEFDITVDSAYEPEIKPFTVLSQQPDGGAVVKNGRMLFLTVNKAEPPKTTMPNLIGLSFRSASLILKSNRLILGDTSYKPDIAKGAILEQLISGEKIKPGQIIPQGSHVDLVIGDGLGQTEMMVPELIGQSYVEAMATISAMGLQANAIFVGDIQDSATAIVYNQQPKAVNAVELANMIHEGDIVDIFVKQEPTLEELEENKTPGKSVKKDTTR